MYKSYLPTNFKFFLKKRLAIKIQHIKSKYANINLDITHSNIFTSSSAEDLP